MYTMIMNQSLKIYMSMNRIPISQSTVEFLSTRAKSGQVPKVYRKKNDGKISFEGFVIDEVLRIIFTLLYTDFYLNNVVVRLIPKTGQQLPSEL